MSIKILRKQRKTNQGITLIALVITIIVLLILAGISIASLTGENGVLTKANKASTENEIASAKEKVQVAVMGSFGNDGKINNSELKANLEKVEGIDKATIPSEITDITYPFDVTVDGHKTTIEKNGKVTVKGDNPTPNPPTSITVEEAKNKKTILDENNPTTIKDTYENEVKVPEGFKIAEDSATEVTGGVVIEDVSHKDTAGSQFVWIPVGTVYTSQDQSTTRTIALGRYSFDENGTPNPYTGNEFKEENSKDTANLLNYGNTIAKDIEAFKTSAITNKGYYIGRYEARSVTERISEGDDTAQVTVKPNDYVYNYVTQPQAAQLARGMYKEGKQFTSDLINSYAFDTAIVFLQTFDDRANKTPPYSKQNSLNAGSLAPKGTNHLTDQTKQDKICNVWDMASNDVEWTTETCDNGSGSYPCVGRYSGGRGSYAPDTRDLGSFRIVLYL